MSEPPHIVNVTVQPKHGGCGGCFALVLGAVALLVVLAGIGAGWHALFH